VSSHECTEIVRRARGYLRVVRNVADNRDLDGDLARLERELKHKPWGGACNHVLNLAQFRRSPGYKPGGSVVAGPTIAGQTCKSALRSFLIDLGLFACFVCLLCSVCSLVGVP